MEFLIRDKNGQFYSKDGWTDFAYADILDSTLPQDRRVMKKYLNSEYQIIEFGRYYNEEEF